MFITCNIRRAQVILFIAPISTFSTITICSVQDTMSTHDYPLTVDPFHYNTRTTLNHWYYT